MAFINERTKIAIFLVLVNFVSDNNCESDGAGPYNDALDDIRAIDQIFRGDSEIPVTKEDISILNNNTEPEKTDVDYEDKEVNENVEATDRPVTNSTLPTTEAFMTTTEVGEEIPEALGLKNNSNKSTEDIDYFNDGSNSKEDIENTATEVTPVDATDTVTDDLTLSMLDNNVYISRDTTPEDIYPNVSSNSNNIEGTRTETSYVQATTRAMDDMDNIAKTPDLQDDLEVLGPRNPKTENSEPKQPIDKRNNDVKPRAPPALSKSSTLKGWLEDSWLRPPAGILIPLRPMALNRALAVWNDLTAGGLNVSDVVIVGYDMNGINWRSRHSLKPTSGGTRDRDVTEALSKLLLKYQGVYSDSTSDGTMRALATAAKLVPYDSALFVVTDKGAGDPQRLPLALRALVEKRLKVYTIWTDPYHPSPESEAALQELRNISKHTEGEVLPYSLQVMDVENPDLSPNMKLQWAPLELKTSRRGRVNLENEFERFDTLLVRRGGGEAISLGLPVESGVTALKIFIEGAVEHAVLYPPNDAPQIDLYNASSVTSFSPASRTDGITPRDVYLLFPGAKPNEDMLAVLPVNPVLSAAQAAMVGIWHLSVRCDTCDYRLCIAARSQIHLDVEAEGTDMLRLRVTGPVATVRESLLVDEYGTEITKLDFSYPPMASATDTQLDPVGELVADLPVPTIKGSKVYLKIVGRNVRGEPFARLAGPLDQPEVRMGRSASLVYPEPTNDLERAEDYSSRVYSRLRYNDSNILPYNRAMSQVMNQAGSLLTAVQIGLSSRMYGSPGDSLQLHFEVTNYRDQSVRFNFGAVGELRFLSGINPTSQVIASGQTVNVIVSLTITSTAQPGARDLITFTAYGLEQVSISAYVYVVNPGETTNDVWPPELNHNFQGTCIGRMGTDCAQHVWSATVIARDALGGLLRLTSSPIGLVYDSNFISGSRDEMVATYRATCCAPRVMITAIDTFGNVNGYVVDISNYYTAAGIAAIVLGVLLAIVIIILLVYLIYWCVRRRRESRELPSYATSSRNIS